jgi:trimethylamine---corrinoid protein Co-methyltransferase
VDEQDLVIERGLVHAEVLAQYVEPALDPAKDEEPRNYVARRSREIPAVDALNDER